MPQTLTEKPPKPYAKFPLFAHRNGSWTKTIGGAHVRFGAWRWPDREAYEQSWKAALAAFEKYDEAAARGLFLATNPREVDIGSMCDGYLTEQHDLAENGSIKARTFAERRETITGFRDAVGADTTVGQLEANPRPVEEYVRDMEVSLGFHRFNNAMQRIRCFFKWGAKPNGGMLGGVPFRHVELFAKRKIRLFRRQRRQEREAGRRATFDTDEILALINHSAGQLTAMILLGYFASYGNTDLGELPDVTAGGTLKVYDQDQPIYLHGRQEVIPKGWGLLYFPRPKTELDRWAIVPPIVVDALKVARAFRPKPKRAADGFRQFLTKGGEPVCYEVEHRDKSDLIERVTVTDNVRMLWDRLLERIGHCEEHGWQKRARFIRRKSGEGERDKTGQAVRRYRRGERKMFCPICRSELKPMQQRGFYSLRHTSTTRATGSGASSDTRNLFEGHAAGSVRQTFYLDPTQMHDLLLIGRHLAGSIGLSESASLAPPGEPAASAAASRSSSEAPPPPPS